MDAQMNLNPKQQNALQQFRDVMKNDLKPHHDDVYLLRWLRARNYDVDKAEKMLRNHLRWRDWIGADSISETWTWPEVLKLYYPGGLFGYDKQGCPIYIENIGYGDFKGILHSSTKSDILKMKAYMCENIQQEIKNQSIKVGHNVGGLIIIFDMERFGLKHLWKPAMDVYNEVLTLFEAHYPETLKTCYIINAPRILPVVFRIFRPFLSEDTQKKVHVLGKHWKEGLLEYIDADQLPVHWGGTATDPDGDPYCKSKIGMGGEVPTKYYKGFRNDQKDMIKQTVGRGSSFPVVTEVNQSGSVISWYFYTDGCDIGYGLFKKNNENSLKPKDMKEINPIQRVNSHMIPEDGSYICDTPGTYILHFDNTYSWLTEKKVWYSVTVLPPDSLEDIKKSPSFAVPAI